MCDRHSVSLLQEVLYSQLCNESPPKRNNVIILCECIISVYHIAFRVTCIYLACKVEEFNVSIQQFVANIKGDREKATDIILNNELLLMEQLNFHLCIHNPFRPVEGLLIDIKVT